VPFFVFDNRRNYTCITTLVFNTHIPLDTLDAWTLVLERIQPSTSICELFYPSPSFSIHSSTSFPRPLWKKRLFVLILRSVLGTPKLSFFSLTPSCSLSYHSFHSFIFFAPLFFWTSFSTHLDNRALEMDARLHFFQRVIRITTRAIITGQKRFFLPPIS
jgi:hypothetical protein